MGSTHGQTTSGKACHHRRWTSSHSRTASSVACHHRLWTQNAVKQRWAWHAIIAFGQHIRSKDVRRGMPSSHLGSTNGRTTSGMACHHRRWTRSHSQTVSGVACHLRLSAAQMVERGLAWHAIIAVGLAHTVGRRRAWHVIIALRWQTRSNDVGCGMTSSPLDSINSRMTSDVARHHRLWAAHRVERRQEWHAIIAFGQ